MLEKLLHDFHSTKLIAHLLLMWKSFHYVGLRLVIWIRRGQRGLLEFPEGSSSIFSFISSRSNTEGQGLRTRSQPAAAAAAV